ncbi:MAG: AAA family ATPase [Deltaproteobacteria bacterium]|nr:AAA family ATPase [Deltaproteobacteria bacterium]
MHLNRTTFYPEKYPTKKYYPFNLTTFHQSQRIEFSSLVTFFIGENGTGKSTLLEAIAHKCGIHIWKSNQARRVEMNPYEEDLYKYISVEWNNVPGSFFSSAIFGDFSRYVDEWAASDRSVLKYFGGKSLITQSHGQSLMSFFKARYRIKGLYLLDEPETALSPKSQLGLLRVIGDMSNAGHAQFIIATHSPILMAFPKAIIYSFNHIPLKQVDYEETEYYRIYKDFMEDREKFLKER